ncbi:MAG: hypothetical protein QW622_02585 [Candidatus Pacearchaeota archaeon]
MERREKNIKKEKKNTKKKITTGYIIAGIVLILISFLAYLNYKSANFEYLGLKFSKVRFGELRFYYARIPLLNSNGEISGYYDLYLRNDPRKLKDIPINGRLKLKTKVIIASDNLKCEDSGIAGGELGGVLSIWTRVKVGTTNKSLAEEKNINYVTCNEREIIYLDSSILIFKPDNVTEINQIGGRDCYEIYVKDCEVLKAVEKFIIGLYAESRGIKL